jgi:ABC-type branched-subunit amino acid transport system substrate-binding protein
MSPLTGLVEIYGTEITQAARIACNEINERGGRAIASNFPETKQCFTV